MTSVQGYWLQLVTAGLLGTDRREVPAPPAGPIADAVDDQAIVGAPGRLLAAVAVTTAAQRGGMRPLAPVAPLAAPPMRAAATVPSPAAAAYWQLRREWPLLEDDWLEAVAAGGWSLPPDIAVDLVQRHRPGSPRRQVVDQIAGELGAWLAEHRDEAGPWRGEATPGRPGAASVDPPVVTASLSALVEGSADLVAEVVAGGFLDDEFSMADRAVLVNLVSLLRPDVLGRLGRALRVLPASVRMFALAADLADEVELRDRYHRALSRPPTDVLVGSQVALTTVGAPENDEEGGG